MTEKLYLMDRYLKKAEAQVLEIGPDYLILDMTIFAPEAGGQVSDTGKINGIVMKYADEKNGVIRHFVENTGIFKVGKNVTMELDWERRFDHMQNHCGEHILSGVFYREYNLENKGFHLGEDIVTMDIDAPKLTDEMLKNVEIKANEAVFANVPISIKMFETKKEAESMPTRKPIKFDEDVSIVYMEGVDCVACCCPHPAYTSEVGMIKIVKTEKYKGMTRLYIKCGMRALADYQLKHDIVTALDKKYSAEDHTLIEKIKAVESKNNVLRMTYNNLLKKYSEAEADRLVADRQAAAQAAQAEGTAAPLNMILMEYETGTVEDLMMIAKYACEKTDLPVVLATAENTSVLLSQGGKADFDCGGLVKEYALGSGGKGGGNKTQARALFNDIVLMRNFIDIIKASLR